MVENILYLLQHYESPEEGSAAMNEWCSIPGQSNNSQHPVPHSDTMGPYHSDIDPTAIDMGPLVKSSICGTSRTCLEAACAPDADVSVRQPQHLSTNNDYRRSSKRSVRGRGFKGTPSVVGQAGMSDPGPRSQKPKKRFTPEEDELLLKLREQEQLTWPQISESFAGRSSNALEVRYCRKLKFKSANESSQGATHCQKSKKRFTPEEDELLIKLREQEQLTWPQISESFPGRSSNALEIRYGRKLKSKSSNESSQGATSRTGSEDIEDEAKFTEL